MSFGDGWASVTWIKTRLKNEKWKLICVWFVVFIWFFCRVAVRYGRVPKRSRERGGSTAGDDGSTALADARSPLTFADPSTTDSSDSCVGGATTASIGVGVETDSRQLLIYDTILTVTQAHHAHCAYTEEKTRAVVRTAVHVVSYYLIIL